MEASANELTCKELVELVTDYFEGKLSVADQQRWAQHMSKCDWCKLYLEQMQLTVKALGKLTEESIPPHAKERLLSAFRDWKRG